VWRWCEGAAERGKARVIRVDKERERRWRGLECSRWANDAANRDEPEVAIALWATRAQLL
jgi:hypothetical protein